MKEIKIVLAVKDEKALYLFRKDYPDGKSEVEFVIGYTIGHPKVGDFVDGWANGHYFFNLEKAAAYFNNH
jgi:hypothetical protein